MYDVPARRYAHTADVTPEPKKRSKRALALGLVAAGLLSVGGASLAYAMPNHGPYQFLMKDSGIAACQAMSAKRNPVKGSTNNSSKISESDYKALRKVFTNSRYGDIRSAGAQFVDSVWQASGTSGFGVLLVAGSMMASYTNLAGACANHGIVLPPLTTN